MRHPFSRLLSAYQDKLVAKKKGRKPKFYKVVQTLKELYRKNNGSTKTEKLSFEIFLEHLVDNPSFRKNPHWDTIENVCNPCQVNYDFIGKLETLQEDSDYILSHVLKTKLHFPPSPHPTNSNRLITYKYFQTLSPELVKKISKVYSRDAENFGYSLS